MTDQVAALYRGIVWAGALMALLAAVVGCWWVLLGFALGFPAGGLAETVRHYSEERALAEDDDWTIG